MFVLSSAAIVITVRNTSNGCIFIKVMMLLMPLNLASLVFITYKLIRKYDPLGK